MRFLATAIIIAPLMLSGAHHAMAQSTLAPVQVTAADSTVDREGYARQARDDMQEWERKLHEVGDQAAAKGKAAGIAAENGLRDAWAKAKDASRKLQSVGAEGWDNAKASYETASGELKTAWHRDHPDDK